MVVPGDITLAELWRRQDRHESGTGASFKALDDRITATALVAVPREVYEERHNALRQRIEVLEETQESSFVYRRNALIAVVVAVVTTVGAVVTTLIAALVH